VALKTGTFLDALTSHALTSSNIDRFKLISLSESGEHFNNTVSLSLKIPPHLKCRYTTLWFVIVLKQHLKTRRLL